METGHRPTKDCQHQPTDPEGPDVPGRRLRPWLSGSFYRVLCVEIARCRQITLPPAAGTRLLTSRQLFRRGSRKARYITLGKPQSCCWGRGRSIESLLGGPVAQGQSDRLITGWLQVRILPGPPFAFVAARGTSRYRLMVEGMAKRGLVSDPALADAHWFTDVLRYACVLGDAAVTGVHRERIGTGQMGQNVAFSLIYDRPAPGAPATVVGKFP